MFPILSQILSSWSVSILNLSSADVLNQKGLILSVVELFVFKFNDFKSIGPRGVPVFFFTV